MYYDTGMVYRDLIMSWIVLRVAYAVREVHSSLQNSTTWIHHSDYNLILTFSHLVLVLVWTCGRL